MQKSNHAYGSRLFAVSFLVLFLEMAVIRYINSTVQVVAYFNSLLIISAFLGLGFGTLFARHKRLLLPYFPLMASIVLLIVTWMDRFGFKNEDVSNIVFFLLPPASNRLYLPIPVAVLIVFVVNFLFFVPPGQYLGYCLNRFQNRLLAYSYDLLGSLLGVIVFSMLSWLETPPVIWFSIASLMIVFLVFLENEPKSLFLRTVAAIFALAWPLIVLIPTPGIWSPYYKISFHKFSYKTENKTELIGYSILVDKSRIQDALNFSPILERTPFGAWKGYYQLPYDIIRPDKVLILGGGCGNDATFALKANADVVDVVEIDPIIVKLGYSLHPHKPYRDSRVSTISDDARAYLRRTNKKYDLIVMNALDSHHQVPGLSTLRLESFMYTVEAFEDALKRLEPGGILVVNLSSTRRWMGERLYWSLTKAYGSEPLLFRPPNNPFGSIAFVLGGRLNGSLEKADSSTVPTLLLKKQFHAVAESTALATDDWPHLYLAKPSIPKLYVIVLVSIIMFTFGIFALAGRSHLITNSQMFFLGAGFMLLETRSITQIALLFGSTWLVNAIVIASILLLIWFGNLLVMKQVMWKKRLCYTGLFLSLILGYAVPIQLTLALPFWIRVLVVGFWVSIPIFFASLVFSHSFRTVPDTAQAFGANMLGAVAGGTIEYASMLFGLNFLYLLAIMIYFGALASDLRWFSVRTPLAK